MPSQDLIDVRIVVDGAPLCELPDVAAPQDERVQTRYVEVKTGQTFSVEVELQEGFEFHTASYVHVSVYFDYNKDPERKAAGYDGIGIILQRPHVIEFSDMRFKDQETGKWYSSAFKFGDLALGESCASRHQSRCADGEQERILQCPKGGARPTLIFSDLFMWLSSVRDCKD